MEKKQLGNTGIQVAPLAFGGNVFGWTIDQSTSFKLLDSFFSAGYNFIDSADIYSRWKEGNKGGESETIIGNWMNLRKNRSSVILATKVGGDMGAGKSLSKKYILQSVNDSLQRLQTDYIDLYQSHFDDLTTPVEETIEAFAHLQNEGKIRSFGCSNFSLQRIKASLDYCKANHLPSYQTFQPEYNLYQRSEFEEGYKDYCLENNISVICYYALASGFLTGKYRGEKDLSKSIRGGGIKKYLNPRGFRILDSLDKIAKTYKVSPATIALSWLQCKDGVIPIASATTLEQLKDLTDSGNIKLDPEYVELLSSASSY